MSLRLNSILFFSRDPFKLTRFYSDLFDLEVVPKGPFGGVLLRGNDFNISILKFSDGDDELSNSKTMEVEVDVKQLDELWEVFQKVKFQLYRLGGSEFRDYMSDKVFEDKFCHWFQLRDPEGHLWRFCHYFPLQTTECQFL